MILNDSQKESYVDFQQENHVDEFAFEDLGSISVSKVFKPTLKDLKLLKGTREWGRVKEEHEIENIEEEESKDGSNANNNEWRDQQGLNDYQDNNMVAES